MNHDVFISYSKKDAKRLKPLRDALTAAGIKYWIDDRIDGSENFLAEIPDAIRKCSIVLFVASQNSANSEWTQKELLYARNQRKEIFPYKLDDFKFENCAELDFFFTNIQWKESVNDVVAGLEKKLGVRVLNPIPVPTPQPTPIRVKKYWWVTLCVVVIGVFGWVWSNRESADYPNIEENIPSEIITEEIKSDDSDANAELDELRATQERLGKENNELKHNNEELENNNKDLQKDIDNIKPKEEAERQAKLQAEKKAKKEAEKSAKLQAEKKTKQNTIQTQTIQKVEAKEDVNKYNEQKNIITKTIVAKEVVSDNKIDIRDNEKNNFNLPDDEFVPFKGENGKYGYKLKSTGKIVIPATYYKAYDFSGELAPVSMKQGGGAYGFINKNGEVVTDFKYDITHKSSDGMILVEGPHPKNTKVPVFGYIDNTGKEVIPLQYYSADNFSEGLAPVRLKKNGKYGFIDKTGKTVIPFNKYDYAKSFSEGLAAVMLDDKFLGKWGFIDKTGNEVIPLEYMNVSSFSEGLARVCLFGSRYGYIDKTGKVVISSEYEDASSFSDGKAKVKLNGEEFYIDKNGNRIE